MWNKAWNVLKGGVLFIHHPTTSRCYMTHIYSPVKTNITWSQACRSSLCCNVLHSVAALSFQWANWYKQFLAAVSLLAKEQFTDLSCESTRRSLLVARRWWFMHLQMNVCLQCVRLSLKAKSFIWHKHSLQTLECFVNVDVLKWFFVEFWKVMTLCCL